MASLGGLLRVQPSRCPSAKRAKDTSLEKVSAIHCRHLNFSNRARAVAELIALYPHLLEQRQVEIRDRRFLRQHDMLAAELHFSVAAADQDVRLWIVVVQVAIAHVRPVYKN